MESTDTAQDSSDPTLFGLLDADVLVTLTPTDDPCRVQVTVAERGFGTLGSVYLQPDLLHARFTDVPGNQGADRAAVELADAALPYTSGAERGLPASLTHTLDALRTAVLADDRETLAELGTGLVHDAAQVPLPDTGPGHRLAAALRAFCQSAVEATDGAVFTKDGELRPESSAGYAEIIAEVAAGRQTAPSPGDGSDESDDEEDERDVLKPGDEENEPKDAVFPGLRILKDAVGRSKMHPIPVIRTEDRDSDPWLLMSEHMDGEPRWVHPDVTVTRVPYIRENGTRVCRDQIDVPDSFGGGVLCLIDCNGSYPSACSAVPLAPNKLLHTGPLDAFDKSQAGIYLIDIPHVDAHRHAAPAGAARRQSRCTGPRVGHQPAHQASREARQG
ncbi:hypothetical protein [Streptomyces sp. Ag109_O5-1]|uniref:hypothetical protein n=1 Tax=Streptomyces sp. Ag109_O5-1 TaxID=1938851 RepID=UPI0021A7D194|nr:hypothetical protein [Streptomyces sp. Ag109_O5-1]